MLIREAKLVYRTINKGKVERLESPRAVLEYCAGAFDEDPTVEWFYVILLNTKMAPLGRTLISRGILNATQVHCREIFKAAIGGSAAAIICVHNHPSGDPTPSTSDIQVTRKIAEAGRLLEIQLKDHVIVGNVQDDPSGLGFYSFAESGLV